MTVTNNFGFTLLDGSDYAGFTSINTLINSIDTMLAKRIYSGDINVSYENKVLVANENGEWVASFINTANIANNAITTAKIADSNVTTNKIIDAAVTTNKLNDSAVTTQKISDDAVTTDKLADQSVTAAKLNANLTTQLLPSGMITPFAGTTAPTGWLLCDGSALDSDANPDYSGLWDVLGTTYGGTGTSNFNLPDMQGRVPVGLDGSSEFTALNVTGGSKTVTLTANESGLRTHQHPSTNTQTATTGIAITGGNHSHPASTGDAGVSHSINAKYHSMRISSPSTGTIYQFLTPNFATFTSNIWTQGHNNHSHTASTSDAGHTHGVTDNGHVHSYQTPAVASSSAIDAHTNLQPYITLNYIIKI